MHTAHKGDAPSFSRAGFAHPATNVQALGVQPGMLIADFGSGSGAYVLAIAKELLGSGHVFAIDIQKDLLRRIQNEASHAGYTNVEILWGDLEVPGGSKIADDTLELVIISNLLFQVPDKNVVIEEAMRILRPSGRLAIIDWSESYGGMGPHEDDVVSKATAFGLAKDVGFTFVEEFAAGAHHFGLLFRKVVD